MTGTNITVLDNFFYNIEKNIFSTIVLKSQKGLWKKGAARLKIVFFFLFFFKETKSNTTANQQKLNSRPSFQQLLLLP